jgi:hypothetical protein
VEQQCPGPQNSGQQLSPGALQTAEQTANFPAHATSARA